MVLHIDFSFIHEHTTVFLFSFTDLYLWNILILIVTIVVFKHCWKLKAIETVKLFNLILYTNAINILDLISAKMQVE